MKKINSLFLVCVILPTLVSVTYYGFIASDVYISESRFVVRSPQRKSPSLLGAALQGAGFTRSQDDTYMVNDYILSRDALTILNDKLSLREAFEDKGIDFLSRFNGLGFDDSFEEFHNYYQKKVDFKVNSLSSIATLKVRAFSPEKAHQVNEMLLNMGETLVNQLNERGRQDLIRFATTEVQNAEARSLNATLALSQYRDSQGVVNPELQATIQLEQVSQLQQELIDVKGKLSQLRTFARDNPQIPSLTRRVQTLQEAIDSENMKVTGGQSSLANKAADYQRLVLSQEFADKQFGAALASLELARNEALRKQVYVERLIQANLPDAALEPHRISAILSTFFVGLVVFSILTMLLAGMREHLD